MDNPLIDVQTGVDFFNDRDAYLSEFPRIIYTGMIDKFFDYQYGELGYRSLKFEKRC
ncbi:UDP-galactopyranose mutase [Weissella viridescens]|uniref:UDP-galactopyranose mutase n=1 Tax=Weissella viridescens TaxID=1629 RepID=A0A380P2T6_WEIVI|nr:UDP-galactopyranose mutase [Weissella viridescens]